MIFLNNNIESIIKRYIWVSHLKDMHQAIGPKLVWKLAPIQDAYKGKKTLSYVTNWGRNNETFVVHLDSRNSLISYGFMQKPLIRDGVSMRSCIDYELNM